MSVVWAASSPVSGRFVSSDVTSEWEVLQERFDQLRASSQGYIEVHRADSEFPFLTLSFRGDYAVLEMFDDAESEFLLKGDGVVPESDDVQVPVTDEIATFTGDFVHGTERAWGLVRDFVSGRPVDQLGQWYEL